MSWIFSFLLLCYASVRLVLWARGQWRWLSLRHELPVPPEAIEPPEHLSSGLALLFARCRQLRIDLTQARRMLATVAATDPDVPLGVVRDSRYRRALMESWTHLRTWLRESESLDASDVRALADLGLTSGQGSESAARGRGSDLGHIADIVGSLRDRWRAVARARALDTFPLADLYAVQAALDRAERELIMIEATLARVPDDPYRDRFVDHAVAH